MLLEEDKTQRFRCRLDNLNIQIVSKREICEVKFFLCYVIIMRKRKIKFLTSRC